MLVKGEGQFKLSCFSYRVTVLFFYYMIHKYTNVRKFFKI
jgi:hypothetical protein